MMMLLAAVIVALWMCTGLEVVVVWVSWQRQAGCCPQRTDGTWAGTPSLIAELQSSFLLDGNLSNWRVSNYFAVSSMVELNWAYCTHTATDLELICSLCRKLEQRCAQICLSSSWVQSFYVSPSPLTLIVISLAVLRSCLGCYDWCLLLN